MQQNFYLCDLGLAIKLQNVLHTAQCPGVLRSVKTPKGEFLADDRIFETCNKCEPLALGYQRLLPQEMLHHQKQTCPLLILYETCNTSHLVAPPPFRSITSGLMYSIDLQPILHPMIPDSFLPLWKEDRADHFMRYATLACYTLAWLEKCPNWEFFHLSLVPVIFQHGLISLID